MNALYVAVAGHATRTPGAPALIWNGTVTTYEQLLALVEEHRGELAALGLASGEPVGVAATKSPDTIATVLACLSTGQPVLLPSPALPDATLAQLFARAGCRHILGAEPDRELAGAEAAEVHPVPPGISFLLTTSGSTGLPKTVPLFADAVWRFIDWARTAFGIGPGTTVLNYAPLNFDLSLLDVWSTLSAGGTVVLVDAARAANGPHLLDLLLSHHVEVVQAVPMFYRLVHDAAERAGLLALGGASTWVRHAICTGDAMPEQLLAALPAMFPEARLYNIYGCTETNDSMWHEIEPADLGGQLPIGRPLPGVDTLLLDADGQPFDGPGTGELLVRTPFQAPGYLDPRRFADKFGPHPTGADAHRWFRTGDIVRRDEEDRVYLVGRRDHQVKVRGVAVNTAEVEQVLLRHPEVVEAAVVAEVDPLAGARLVAYVRRLNRTGVNSLVLREHCARRLPQAAVPTVLRLVDAPLPRTSTGKVDRRALSRPADTAGAAGAAGAAETADTTGPAGTVVATTK